MDAGKVADLAKRIEQAEIKSNELKKGAETADRLYNSASCELSNLKIEFTRLVSPVLDKNTLSHPLTRSE